MHATTNKPNPAAVVMRSGSSLAQPLVFLALTLGQESSADLGLIEALAV